MEIINNEEERYYQAKKQVEEIKGFYGHLISFVIVNIGLLVLNLLTSPKHLWFFWPMLGWGIGLFFHGIKVFNFSPFFNKEWEERKIREYMERENQSKNKWD
ncbi:MAG: 2TM domain-containing protein [Flavobacterium sp.]|nr:2TM domain-containing protein [Flavobacterium sp.]